MLREVAVVSSGIWTRWRSAFPSRIFGENPSIEFRVDLGSFFWSFEAIEIFIGGEMSFQIR